MIQLRDYQDELVNEIRAALAAGRKAPLVVLPTGGGKTTIFSYVANGATGKGKTVFLLAHRAELVKQIAGTLARFECPHQVIAPGPIIRQCQVAQHKATGRSWVDHRATAYVASVQTLVKRLDKLPAEPDIIVVDEAHHLTAGSTWGVIAARYPNARLLPVTATPCRLDGKGLGVDAGGFADELVLGPSMGWLIEHGYLSPYTIFAPPSALDLSGVKKRAGDYAKDQLGVAVDKPVITGSAVQHYLQLARGKRAIAFCVSVEHAQHVAEQFNAAGIPAESLDGSQSPEEREARIGRFERGETLVLTSCDIVSEGFDLPAIEVAILLRPTTSLSLFLQQVGRALRVFPGKDRAIILDHVGAVQRHGLPCEEREWSLDGVVKKKRAANDNDPVAVQTCPQCYAVTKPSPVCPACGHIFKAKARSLQEAEGHLVEITPELRQQMKARAEAEKRLKTRARITEERDCQTLEELVELGRRRGYQFPKQWAERKWGFRKNRPAGSASGF